MKLTFICTSVLLALALGGCGGGKATFELGGPVVKLYYPGLVMTNVKNGDTVAVAVPATPGADTTFKLPRTVEYGDLYDVQITAQPANEDCAVGRGADTAGRLSTISIIVSCAVKTFPIGGVVSGLRATADATPTGLVITNGTDQRTIEADGAYLMPTAVEFGATYGVTIVTQPTGKTCTIKNASGVVNTTSVAGTVTTGPVYTNPVNNIDITCV